MHVSLSQPLFAVRDLTVGLLGTEDVHFTRTKSDGDGGSKTIDYYGYFEVIRLEVPISQFPDGPPRVGTWSYPFTLEIPDWLPSSSIL